MRFFGLKIRYLIQQTGYNASRSDEDTKVNYPLYTAHHDQKNQEALQRRPSGAVPCQHKGGPQQGVS